MDVVAAVGHADREALLTERGPLAKELLGELLRHLGLSSEVTVRRAGDELQVHAKLVGDAEAVGLGGERPPLLEPVAYLLGKMVNRGQPDGAPRVFVRLTLGDELPPLPIQDPQRPAAPAPTSAGTGAGAPSPADDVDPEAVEAARWLAERAKVLGKTLTVGPMTARERRSVHLAVKEVGGVTTRSEGEGLLRRVLVIPEAPVTGDAERKG